MSKLIDYAGLTEFYNKFKDEITAPEIVDLWFQESSWSDNDKNINITALSKFETKWKNLHGTGNKVAYFLGRFSNGMGAADTVSMLFVKKQSEYVAISNIKLGDDNDIFDTVTHLYRYTLSNTGKLTMNEVIYANKQDKLTSGTNIKTVNGQSLLGSGDITIKGDVTKCRINANTLVAEPTGNEPMIFKMPLADVQKYENCNVIEIYVDNGGSETIVYNLYHLTRGVFLSVFDGKDWVSGRFIGDEATTDENKIGFEITNESITDTVDKNTSKAISSRAVYTALQDKQDNLSHVLKEIDLTGTDAERKAKLDQFAKDWKTLTNATDMTGARFACHMTTTTGEGYAILVYDGVDGAYIGVVIDDSHKSYIVYVAESNGSIFAEPVGGNTETDTSMSDTSTNPVQNKVIKAYIDGLVGNVAAQLAQI